MFSKSAVTLVLAALLITIVSVGCGQSRSRTYVVGNNSRQGWLGVEVQDVSRRIREKKHVDADAGAYVTKVIEESPAEESGIHEGDVIVNLDGITIEDSDDLTRAVRHIKPKTEVKLDVVRGKDRKTLTVTIGRTPAPRAYSFRFNDGEMAPSIPRIPFRLHMFSSQTMYGMEVQSLTKQLGEYFEVPKGRGVLVTEVKEASGAEKAGFKAGDIITKVNESAIRDVDELRQELSDNDDKSVQCEVFRKGKALTLTLQAGEDDEDDDDFSGNIALPGNAHHWQMYEGDLSGIHRHELSHLKEHLKELGEKLKESLHRLKERIHEDLRNL
jgi:S1-C subfamily serine protease